MPPPKMPFQLSWLTLGLAVTAVYVMWMDVALYINLQKMPPIPPRPANDSAAMYSSAKPVTQSFSPVYPVHVKMLMQGPISHYIYNSLSRWIVNLARVATFMTPDAVSLIGVLFALVSARLITSDALRTRQLGVLFWQLRDLMDDLDGWVARERNAKLGFRISTSQWGYYKDGIFDGFGIAMFLMGFTVHLYKSFMVQNVNGLTYRRLDVNAVNMEMKKNDDEKVSKDVEAMGNGDVSSNGAASEPDKLRLLRRRLTPCLVTGALIAGQIILSSVCWNVAILGYHRLLESYQVAHSPAQMAEQNLAMKSATLWMVVYLWRWINPIMLVQYLNVALLYSRGPEYACAVQRVGFVPIVLVAMLTQVYYWIVHADIVAAETVVA